MQGYTTNYINLIADNLRDRYDNDFSILKELIQNADDAKARSFIFAFHPGFRDTSPHIHSLLAGPGLWFFNDGAFKASDARALRSFGINSKAGDATAIGKFGLGMKSVFHLCEALFYVAWDGRDFHCEGLTPWKQEDHNPHREWDESHDDDWRCLQDLGRQSVTDPRRSWFLLWIPLRKRDQLQTENGEETGAIISRFPGDDPARELAFLDKEDLALELAELLPLLRHLERIEHRDDKNAFVLKLEASGRLLSQPGSDRTDGQVTADPDAHSIRFAGLRRSNHDPDGLFSGIKQRDEWPRSWYRDDNGHEHLAEDKTTPEGAVLFCSGPASERHSDLQWAVFLPVEQGGDKLRHRSEDQGHSLTLHGQFFIDAGRKKIHGLEYLDKPPEPLGDGLIDNGLLRRTWNQQLAQQVLLPLVLPALQHYAESVHLAPEACASLTEALANTKWFSSFKSYVCSEGAWVQLLERNDKPVWSLVDTVDRDRLRPFPEPPKSDPGRPWRVFRRLSKSSMLPFSADAPSLMTRHPQWQEEELAFLLSDIDGLFADGPLMDYLAEFLESCAGPFLSTERIQRQLVDLLRVGLSESRAEARRQLAKKSSGLIEYVDPERRMTLQADLPETLLRQLWEIEAPVLLAPRGFSPEQDGRAAPSESTLADWLRVLDQGLSNGGQDANQNSILTAVRGLLKSLDPETRGSFLRIHEGLRITAVHDACRERDRAVSYADVREVRDAGALFGFAGGLGVDRLGLAPRLAAALPASRIWLVKVETYRDLFPDDAGLPRADGGQACLRAIGRDDSGRLGGITERRALLAIANEPGTDADARRGLRYLLHGSPPHRCEDDAALWFPAHAQDPAWAKLWGQMYDEDRWSLVPAALADTVPRTRWDQAGIHEIDAHNLIDELRSTDRDIPTPEDFSVAERDEILSQIKDEALWQRLTLHTTCEGEAVSAARENVYLVPEASDVEDWLLREATLVPLSAYPAVAEKQRKWLKPLDGRARIEIALGTAEPSTHWPTIMDALAGLDTDSEPELLQPLRETPWLPARDGTAVRPDDVIELPGNLHDQAQRLVAEHRVVHGPRFAVPADLSDELQAHESWQRLKIEAFSRGEDALRRLGSLLQDLPDYHIGSWAIAPSPETVELLAEFDSLPGWRLLGDTPSEEYNLGDVWHHLGSGLAQRMAPKGIRGSMEWLSASTGSWKVRKSAFDEYLKQYLDWTDVDRSTFSGLRLANRRDEWRDSSRLCVGADGADTGLDPSFVLDPSQASLLTDLVSHAGGGTSVDEASEERQREIDHRLFRSAREKTQQTLARYFEPWSQFAPGPMIGALIAMLDPTFRDLASEYLQPYSYGWLLDRLDDAGGDSTEEDFQRMQVAVHEIDVASVAVTNLLGDPIDVPLDQEARTLFAGPLSQKRTFRVQVPLRKIDPADIDPDRLSAMLRATAESLCAEIYPPKRDLERLWEELDNSNQLEVQTARRLILNNLPFYLNQLSVRNGVIEDALLAHHRASTAIAQAGDAGDVPAERALGEALEALAAAIANDPIVQHAVLAGVKGKLANFQYELSSIPFELFQNADDAAVELGQIEAHPHDGCSIPDGARRLVVVVDDECLRFLHWGRPINARGPIGFGGERRGYGRDLEKMLILSASDKHADQGVTGKYGLGFKSVLLASNRPRILSGRMAIEVAAGILPKTLEDTDKARASMSRHRKGTKLPGTMIELPDVSEQDQGEILMRFSRLAGVLCAFGRSIRSIELIGEEGENTDLGWNPSEICHAVEHGRLGLRGDWGPETDAICVRVGRGSLLMGLGPKGFRALPDDVPAIWITAPTREQSAVGFALNGGFSLNAGRDRLAGNNDENRELARRIGDHAGIALGDLFERIRDDWPTARKELNLAADLDVSEFWQGLWIALTGGWLKRQRDAAAELAREAAMSLLSRLSELPGAVPNGLPGPYSCCTSRQDVLYELKKPLAEPDVLGLLGVWERFTDKYPAHACVSEDIGAILKHGRLSRPMSLGIAALIGVLDPPRVSPDDALVLGRVLLLTEEESDWKSKEVKDLFKRLSFRNAAGGWTEIKRLLADDGDLIEREEFLRHNLAPPDQRLHPDYYTGDDDRAPAVAFFLKCRERLQAPVEVLAKWVLAAKDDGQKMAALVYLVEGEQGLAVSRKVRGQGWLILVPNDETLLAHFDPEQRLELKRMLASDREIERGIRSDDPGIPVDGMRPSIDLATALKAVYDWWSTDGPKRADEYRQRLYPAFTIDLDEDPETGRCDRSSWLSLFALGAFQGLGRTKEGQHRGFIELCKRRGWWHTFAEIDPKKRPDKWMDIIEKYAEAQHDDEQWTQWIAQFPKLYRLRRWMDDYIDLFLSIDRFDEPFSLELLLTPRDNPHYQGTDFDTPPLNRTLRVGAHLVVRELLHHGVIRNPLAVPHAYAPIERIQGLFAMFDIRVEQSKEIYEHLEEHLGPERARFDEDYDIPLRILAVDTDLQKQLFQ